MTALTERAGTAQTYLAGLGATGAVITGVVSAFLLVVVMVTFDAWPRAATLFGPRAEVEAVNSGELAAPASAANLPRVDPLASRGGVAPQPQTGGGGDDAARVPSGGGGGDRGGGTGPGDVGGGQTPGGSAPTTGGGSAGSAGGSGATSGGTVQQTVDDLGQTVNNTVSGLGETVNDTVSGLGETVDGTLDGVNRILHGLTNTGS